MFAYELLGDVFVVYKKTDLPDNVKFIEIEELPQYPTNGYSWKIDWESDKIKTVEVYQQEDEVTEIKLAMDELAMAMEEEKLATQLALAELADALLGG